jgi:hypothetical protein
MASLTGNGMKAVFSIAMAIAMVGCATSKPISDVIDVPVVPGSGKTLTRTQVATAVERAGRYLGWQMSADGPGLFTARLALRHHIAVVEIEHDDRTYSIRYRDSTNLDAKDGDIHRAYNRWVQRLRQEIRKELELL